MVNTTEFTYVTLNLAKTDFFKTYLQKISFYSTEKGNKVDMICYATARQGQAENSRNLGTTF